MVVSLLVVLALYRLTPLGALESSFLALLLVLMPVLSVAQLPLIGTVPLERIPVYVVSAGVILALGGAGLGLGWAAWGTDAIGLVGLPAPALAGWSAAALAAALAALALFHWTGRILGVPEAPVLRELIPRSPAEKAVFVGLSASAGVGEELAYRGFAIPALILVGTSPWTAAIASSVAFAFLHVYQGVLGTIRSGILGLVLAATFLVSGSLVPAILAHALVDVIAGLVLGDRMLRANPAEAADPADAADPAVASPSFPERT